MCDFAADIAPSIVSCIIGASFLYWQQRQHSKHVQAIEARHDASNTPSTSEAALKPHRVTPISDADDNVPRPRLTPSSKHPSHGACPSKGGGGDSSPCSAEDFDCLIQMLDSVHSETGPPDRVIAKVVSKARELIDCERLSLCTVSEDRSHLVFRDSQDALGLSFPIGNGVAGYVIATRKTINVADAHEDPRFDKSIDAKTRFRTRALLCVPVIANGEAIGVLQAINANGAERGAYDGAFDERDAARLGHLATAAGITLHKAQLTERAVRAQRTTAALYRVMQARVAEQPVHELLQVITDAACALLLAERVTVFLVDSTKGELWAAVAKEKDFEGTRLAIGVGIAGTVAQTGRTINVADAYDDERFDRSNDVTRGFRTRSVLCCAVPGFTSSGVSQGGDDAVHQPIAVVQAINKIGPGGDGPCCGSPVGTPTDADAYSARFDEVDEEALAAFCAEVSLTLKRTTVEAHLLKLLNDAEAPSPSLRSEAQLQSSFLEQFGESSAAKVTANIKIEHVSLTMEHARRPSVQWPVLSSRVGNTQDAGIGPHTRWDFDVFGRQHDELMGVCYDIFDEFNLLQRFDIAPNRLREWIIAVHGLMRTDTAFHNFRHAFSVMHVAHLQLARAANACLRSIDVLAVLIAALSHDLEHPGHSNTLEVARRSTLARLYCDDAPLERHHAAAACRILDAPATNILANVSAADARWARKMVVKAILDTDMRQHSSIVSSLNQRNESSAPSTGLAESANGLLKWDRDCDSDRLQLAGAIVHCSDLSGQAMPQHIARQWGSRVITEFRAQCALEERLGLPVTSFMMGLDDPARQAELQIGFVSHVVLPMWRSMSVLFPPMSEAVSNCEANLEVYKDDLVRAKQRKNSKPLASH